MFKMGSFEQELIEGMSKELLANQIENKYSFDKIAKAADYLNSAAEILDDNGMVVEAEIVTRLLEKIANKKKDKGLKNLKQTGTPFPLKDFDNSYIDDDLTSIDFEDDSLEEEDGGDIF